MILLYGAKDTHCLLHIAQQLILEAKAKGILKEIWDRSDKICQNLYKNETTIACPKPIIKKNDLSTRYACGNLSIIYL